VHSEKASAAPKGANEHWKVAPTKLDVKPNVTFGLPVGFGGFWVMTGVGRPEGVTLFDGADGAPAPAALLATTVNVYAVPLVKPVKIALVPVTVALAPAGLEVTV
jgi:hypothetical protein